MTDASVLIFRRKLLAWGRQHRRSFPWRETDDPFRVLVAEVLLQRSRGKTVATVYERSSGGGRTHGALARARVPSIESVIRPLGWCGGRRPSARWPRRWSSEGECPRRWRGCSSCRGWALRGGRHAAVAFGAHAAVVDGVTARVYRRYFGLDGDRPAVDDPELWSIVRAAPPRRAAREWNWAVLDLAALVCLPGTPRCPSCPLRAPARPLPASLSYQTPLLASVE